MITRRPIRDGRFPHLLRVPPPVAALSGTLFRAGDLEVRVARAGKDVRRAQRLRYKVFYEEGTAVADRTAALIRRDVCPFDRVCDHLLVIDHAARTRFGKRKPKVVGTYRLLRGDVAARHGGFYSATEFDLAPLLARHAGKRFLELGRSCVASTHRTRHTLDLLWRGIAVFIRHYDVDVLIGCASFAGTDPGAHASALRFLREHHRAPDEWRVAALPMRLSSSDGDGDNANGPTGRRALATLPPLIKGYLRCGATIGDGVVVDHQFGTTDVFVVMPVAGIEPRYLARFDTELPAAA